MIRDTNGSNGTSNLLTHYQHYNELSNSYMKMGLIFLEEGLMQPCLVLGHMSIKVMLDGIYLHLNEMTSSLIPISFDTLLLFASEQRIVDTETAIFLNEIYFLINQNYPSNTLELEQAHVTLLMDRIQEIIGTLSVELHK
ncbi:hypothetical protein [Paenibacillus sp. CMAA1364]